MCVVNHCKVESARSPVASPVKSGEAACGELRNAGFEAHTLTRPLSPEAQGPRLSPASEAYSRGQVAPKFVDRNTRDSGERAGTPCPRASGCEFPRRGGPWTSQPTSAAFSAPPRAPPGFPRAWTGWLPLRRPGFLDTSPRKALSFHQTTNHPVLSQTSPRPPNHAPLRCPPPPRPPPLAPCCPAAHPQRPLRQHDPQRAPPPSPPPSKITGYGTDAFRLTAAELPV